MARTYPALDVIWTIRPDDDRLDRLVAEVDEESPRAVEALADRLRIFFPSALARRRAAVRLVALEPDLTCQPVDVPDEDWAARSQADLGSVRVGRLVIAPPWARPDVTASGLLVVIHPSTGFGTGHHASTRLCLQLLQSEMVDGLRVLDVGTGSGVLAIAAARLGAARVLATDHDSDALKSARENVALNAVSDRVRLELAEIAALRQPAVDLVLANLTGATLMRYARELTEFVQPGGSLIASGLALDEAAQVTATFAREGMRLARDEAEDGWSGLRFERAAQRAAQGAATTPARSTR